MFLVESYAQDRLPSLGSRLRLSGAGVSGEVVYAGVTRDGHPVVVPVSSILHGAPCEPIVCLNGVVESVDERTGPEDARALLGMLGEDVNFHLAGRRVQPVPGDVLEALDRNLAYCGIYRGKMVFASRGDHGLQPLGFVESAGLRWNVGAMPCDDLTGMLRGVIGNKLAETIFRSVTSRAYPGARVMHRGTEGTYLRWDGRYGLHHLVAFPINETTRQDVSALDVDRITEVDGTRYAVAFISDIGDSMLLFEFPEPAQTNLALRIEEATPVFRRFF